MLEFIGIFEIYFENRLEIYFCFLGMFVIVFVVILLVLLLVFLRLVRVVLFVEVVVFGFLKLFNIFNFGLVNFKLVEVIVDFKSVVVVVVVVLVLNNLILGVRFVKLVVFVVFFKLNIVFCLVWFVCLNIFKVGIVEVVFGVISFVKFFVVVELGILNEKVELFVVVVVVVCLNGMFGVVVVVVILNGFIVENVVVFSVLIFEVFVLKFDVLIDIDVVLVLNGKFVEFLLNKFLVVVVVILY